MSADTADVPGLAWVALAIATLMLGGLIAYLCRVAEERDPDDGPLVPEQREPISRARAVGRALVIIVMVVAIAALLVRIGAS